VLMVLCLSILILVGAQYKAAVVHSL
jgi:hypothetical protein